MSMRIFCKESEKNHVRDFLERNDVSPIAVIIVRPIGMSEPVEVAIPGGKFSRYGVKKQASASVEEVKRSILAERTSDGKWLIAFKDQSAMFGDKIVLLINDMFYQLYDVSNGNTRNSAIRGIGSGLLYIDGTEIMDRISIQEIAS